ncbi:MerR family DNA-binding protein [Sphingomonas sp. Leaf231]|uniref:MerR family DNA-binding protein n=1 Tax=Sphingomonas sp. Leaf231 TaxID=1736301 RepID=UPI000B33C137
MQHRSVDSRLGRGVIRTVHVCRTLQQPRPPLIDEVRVNVILLRHFGHRPLGFHGGQRHLGLERQAIVSARSLAHLAFCSRLTWPLSDRQTSFASAARARQHSAVTPATASTPSTPALITNTTHRTTRHAERRHGDGTAQPSRLSCHVDKPSTWAPPPVRSAAVGGVENTALTIADLGKATNTKVKTTGYYPRIGPLPKPIRCAGNYRTNGVDEMGCRSFIRRTHDLGLSLDQVFALVDSSDDRACDCAGIGPIANERLQHVDREPADLPALRRELKVSSISVAAAPLPDAGSSKRWAHYRQ